MPSLDEQNRFGLCVVEEVSSVEKVILESFLKEAAFEDELRMSRKGP